MCEAHMVRCRNTRISLDMEDYSASSLNTVKKFIDSFGMQLSGVIYFNRLDDTNIRDDDNLSNDDGFGVLSIHRSFVADALTAEEDDSSNDMMEWADRQAQDMGLLNK